LFYVDGIKYSFIIDLCYNRTQGYNLSFFTALYNRGEALMLVVLTWPTILKIKSKESFYDSVVFHTLKHRKPNQIKCIFNQLIKGVVSSSFLLTFPYMRAQFKDKHYKEGLRGGGNT
jgi:hypothetical protein